MKKALKILVVGQTPPPYGGQAMMIQYMLDANYNNVVFHHVRMCFSREMNERGKMSLYKITHLLSIIFNSIYLRYKFGIDVLYYPPSNAPKVSVFRDLIFLAFVRPFFKKTIFHFHAAGISEFIPQQGALLQKVAKYVLNKPDLAITSSVHNPDDASFLNAKSVKVIPLGIPDDAANAPAAVSSSSTDTFSILFVGLLNSTKGEGFVLEALHILKLRGYVNVQFRFAGKFENEEYKNTFWNRVEELGLTNQVTHLGVIVGDTKQAAFLQADIFCFPSFFESESFGIVLLEAMSYGLPLIASRWRGIQSVVNDGENGYLVDIKNAKQIADKMEIFIKNPSLLHQMGKESRKLFQENYTIEAYLSNLEQTFLNL